MTFFSYTKLTLKQVIKRLSKARCNPDTVSKLPTPKPQLRRRRTPHDEHTTLQL